MKISLLVAALILRVGSEGSVAPLSWAQLGKVLKLTQDQIRHRITAFKTKYNVVDSDVKDNDNWNREFLAANLSDAEKQELAGSKFYPGDIVTVTGGDVHVVLEGKDKKNRYQTFNGTGVAYVFEDDITSDPALATETPIIAPEAPAVERRLGIDEHGDLVATAAPVKQIPKPDFLITPACLIVVRDQQPLTIDKTHKNFDLIKKALADQDWQLVFDLIDLKNTLTKYSNGRVTVEQGAVLFDGKPVIGKLSDRLMDALMNGNSQSLDALSSFMVKSDENPDGRVLSRLFSFMQAKDIRIDKDGDFYAYKVVRSTYMDKHSNTMDNSVGLTVSMKRNLVNPIDSETCSTGLHVCSKSYIKSFGSGGDRIVLCKVNPQDVVSVPTDYGDAKMRVCKYVVVKDVTENFMGEEHGIAPK